MGERERGLVRREVQMVDRETGGRGEVDEERGAEGGVVERREIRVDEE